MACARGSSRSHCSLLPRTQHQIDVLASVKQERCAPIQRDQRDLWGYIAASLVVYRTAAVVVTVRGIDTSTIKGAVFASVNNVIGSVLGSPPTRAFSISGNHVKEGNDQKWKD